MLKFCGTGSVAEHERWHSDHGFGVPIQRASYAMTNYVPIVGRVFSSRSLSSSASELLQVLFDAPGARQIDA